MPRQAATNIDAAVILFAETQEGDFLRIWPNDPYGIRLFAPGAVAVLYVDVEARVLRVGRVFRRR
jgi:hypothetical protein